MKRGHKIPIAEHVNKVLKEIADSMGGGTLRVGFLEGAKYKDGTQVAQVAYWDEFGHGGNFPSPPRLFFRTMVSAKSSDWPTQMAQLAKTNNYNGYKVLKYMGDQIAGDLRESIVNTNTPPLAKSTLFLRSRFLTNPEDIKRSDVVQAVQDAASGKEPDVTSTQSKPLVWTGWMLDNVSYEVTGTRTTS